VSNSVNLFDLIAVAIYFLTLNIALVSLRAYIFLIVFCVQCTACDCAYTFSGVGRNSWWEGFRKNLANSYNIDDLFLVVFKIFF